MKDFSKEIRAPAKLNLSLAIKGLRETGPFAGYHEIESLFVPVSIFDAISVACLSESSHDEVLYLVRNRPLKIADDTISKALTLYRTNVAPVPPLQIRIVKNIPMGAGLGGGSSDAGNFLRFLDEHFPPSQTSDQRERLAETAIQAGADVPFFLESKPALVSGIGEKLKPIEVSKLFFVVIQPDFQVNTKDAYGWYDNYCGLTHRHANVTSGKINEVSGPSFRGDGALTAEQIVQNLKNDFEIPVEQRHPEIIMMKSALRTWGALGTLMSGTGSSVYGIYGSHDDAVKARDRLQEHLPGQYAVFVCETLQAESSRG